MFDRPPSRMSQQQPLAVPNGLINGSSLALSTKYVAVYAALDAVLELREGVEVKIEQSFAVAISDGVWQ